ncbi:MAG: hypothetical protein ACREDK_09075 [Thermoplasmata archaeon]
MPAPGDDAPAEPRVARASRHRPERDEVRRAARIALGRGPFHLPSQAAFRRALLPVLKEFDPTFVVGARRMRAMLLGAPGIELKVRYRETDALPPLQACPVCAGELRPIHNRTLLGEKVVLGARCTQCAYWTHRKRRVPVRYTFLSTGRSRPRAEGSERSGPATRTA